MNQYLWGIIMSHSKLHIEMTVIMILLTFTVVQAENYRIYVGPEGKDNWPGTSEEPKKTIQSAIESAREKGPEKSEIIVKGGEYFLKKPVILTPEDSGLQIRGAEGEKITLFGGIEVTGWKKQGQYYTAAVDMPDEFRFRFLGVGGEPAERSRLPEEGFYEHQSVFDVNWMGTVGGGWQRKPTETELSTLKYKNGNVLDRADINNVEITVYHMWDESMTGVKSIDRKTNTVTFTTPTGHPPGAFGIKRFVVFNSAEGLKQPGQWYYNRSEKKIVYWPREGQDMSSQRAFIPVLHSVLRIEGKADEPVNDVVIRNIGISLANTELKSGGFGGGRYGGAVLVRDAEACAFGDCRIFDTTGIGFKAVRMNKSLVSSCEIYHCGAGGIKIEGSHNIIRSCKVHDIGLVYPSGIGVWTHEGKENLIESNEIYNTSYTAIVCRNDRNKIYNNYMHHVMQVLHDGGGIFITLCDGVHIRGNLISDVADTGGYGSSAYYLDEMTTGCVVEENVSLNTARPSHNHFANNNTIRNNIFIQFGDMRLTFPRSTEYTFVKNVVLCTGDILFRNIDAIETFKDNVIWSKTGNITNDVLERYELLRNEPVPEGQNLYKNPKIHQIRKGAITFEEFSPARRLGIKEVDVSGAGGQ